ASPAQIAHNRRIARGDEIGKGGEPVRGRLPLLVDIHLDGHRNTEQRSGRGELLERAIGRCCLSERLIGEIYYDRVQLGIQRTDAFDDGYHHVRTRKVFFSDTSRDLDRALLPQRLTHDEVSSRRPESKDQFTRLN